jgi:chromosomal replication initiator protein
MNPERIWSAALGELQLQMTKATFETWLRDSHLQKYEDGTFVVAVKNGYAKDWLENRLSATIKRTLARLSSRTVDVMFVVGTDQPQAETDVSLLDQPDSSSQPAPSQTSAEEKGPGERQRQEAAAPTLDVPTVSPSNNLNPRYSFENFVVGPDNRLAHAASVAVTESPATAYNPLFLYGGVGLGKTHLLHAVGHACQSQNLRALYISSETFTNDLIEAIQSHTTDAFREKYRTTDVLLVDDIQFIAGKERTQEEFFHTFNTLHSAGKQIVLSSDRPPKALSTLENRLRSRFEWGLIADIQPPDFETRIAILRSKAEFNGIAVPDEILSFIASQVQSNIRELEGALNQVVAMSQLTNQPLTLKVARVALSNLLPQHRELSPAQIIEGVARHFSLEVSQLKGRSRKRDIARPRQIAMYLIREETETSLPQIGSMLDGRDHSTVLYGCDRVAELIEQDPEFQREVTTLRQEIYNN